MSRELFADGLLAGAHFTGYSIAARRLPAVRIPLDGALLAIWAFPFLMSAKLMNLRMLSARSVPPFFYSDSIVDKTPEYFVPHPSEQTSL